MIEKIVKRRVKGTGYVFSRNGIFYLHSTIKGKRKLISLKTKNRKEAELKVKELLPALEAKTKEAVAFYVGEARKLLKRKALLPISETWTHFFKATSRPDSSEKTLKGHKTVINDFCLWLKNVYPSINDFSEIDNNTASEYARYLWGGKKISERTYNVYIKAMHLIYRVLVPNEVNPFAKENIARKIENQQGRKKLQEKEIISILDSFSNPNLKLIHKSEMNVVFHLGVLTGLRLADCCLLKWDNISFQNGIIRCIPLKTRRIKREAVIPMATTLREQLMLALDWKINDYVLPNVAERYLRNPDGIKRDSKKIFEFSGLKTTQDKGSLQRKRNICRYGFHSFRHSFASIMASNGYNIIMLAKILADDTKTLEKYYINIDENTVKKTFNDIFLPNSNTKLISSDSDKDKLIAEINGILKEKTVEELTKISLRLLSPCK